MTEPTATRDDLADAVLRLGAFALDGEPVNPESTFALAAVLERRGLPTTEAEVLDWCNEVRVAYNGLVR